MNLVCFYNKKPWEREPNKKVFYYKGYKCLILRDLSFGYLKGYVKISKDNNINFVDHFLIDCFEEINFLARISGYDGIFVGFSCNTKYDFIPCHVNPFYQNYEDYRTIAFVEKELCNIVDQIIEKDLFKK